MAGFRGWSPEKEFDHQPTLIALERSSRLACPICRWMWLAVWESVRSKPDIQRMIDADRAGKSRLVTRCKSLQRDGWYGGSGPGARSGAMQGRMIVQFFLTEAHKFETLAYVTILFELEHDTSSKPTYCPAESTGSDVCLDLAKAWFETCVESHDMCRVDRTPDWKPSRLLFLPGSERLQSPTLREGSLNEYGEDVQYMTLSHRWAPDAQLQLLHRTRQRLRLGIAPTELKRSIQDAIVIARHFGIRYLWVDTLCILQDDLEHKVSEITQMNKVYGNSILNIAASDAVSNEQGCFHYRDASEIQSFVVSLDTDPKSPLRHCIRREWQYTTAALDNSPLARRAWVFQERILAPRLLHFGRKEVHWECRVHEASETYPSGKPGYTRSAPFQHPALKTVVLNGTDSTSSPADVARACNVWRRLVEEYTKCGLTFSQDKLWALAGISGVWARLHHDRGAAGLWMRSLLRDLLWVQDTQTMGIVPRRIAREKAAGPSWSWASVEGPVYFHSDHFSQGDQLGRIKLNAVYNPTRGGSMASVEAHPVLHLQGRPVPARWATNVPKGREELRSAKIVLAGQAVGVSASEQKTQPWEDYVQLDDWFEPPPEGIICLPIVHNIVRKDICGVHGLVLAAAPPNNRHQVHAAGPHWQRIGLFHSSRTHLFSDAQEVELHII